MINIEVNTNGNEVHCSCDINITATRAVAVGEFASVLEALERSDRIIFALAVEELMERSHND